jgi:uncharacterized protein YkwD
LDVLQLFYIDLPSHPVLKLYMRLKGPQKGKVKKMKPIKKGKIVLATSLLLACAISASAKGVDNSWIKFCNFNSNINAFCEKYFSLKDFDIKFPEFNCSGMQKPEINKPEVNKPETNKPETNKPETNKPETNKPETEKPEINVPEINTPAESYATELLALVNQARKQQGLSALTLDSSLSAVAQAHSDDMAKNNFFSHTNLKGQSPFDRLKNAGVNYQTAGENIAMGQKNAQEVFSSWMNSQGHRANILNASFNKMGVGLSNSSSKYWTQIFTN